MLIGLPSATQAQPEPKLITYFTRWHVPDLCDGESDTDKCSIEFSLTADNTVLYAFNYHNSKLYQFSDSSIYTEYDLSRFQLPLRYGASVIPFGTDFVLLNSGPAIYKFDLRRQTLSEIKNGSYSPFAGCKNPALTITPTFALMKSGGLVLVCLWNGQDMLDLGLLNPFTEKWVTIVKRASSRSPDWLVLLMGPDNRIYMQLFNSVGAVSHSKGVIVNTDLYTRGLHDQDWTLMKIPVTEFVDWKAYQMLPSEVWVYLEAVDASSNLYFQLYWTLNNGPDKRTKGQDRLVKMSPDNKILWSLADISFMILDVMADGTLIVAQPDKQTRTTSIQWVGVETAP
jgi:hypothetical protein